LDHAMNPSAAGMSALHVLAGQPMLGPQRLGVGDTAFLEASAPLSLGVDDAVLEVELRYFDHSKDIKFSIAER
jgi:hypothetical protein